MNWGTGMEQKQMRKALMQAVKIGIGCSAAIFFAEFFHLQHATSAGSIALLTILSTKWETVKLSYQRVITFFISVALLWIAVHLFKSEWIAFGVYVFGVVMVCEVLGWKGAISVNAVAGAQFLASNDFSPEFIFNQFALVLIGITLAVVLNSFHYNKGAKKELIDNMRYTETQLQILLEDIAGYLSDRQMNSRVWDAVEELEKKMHGFIADAYAYQGNTFVSHPAYYINYFEMRMKQFSILHSLHFEMKKIRRIPRQAAIVADYILYLKDYVVEHNAPDEQIRKLDEIFEAMKKEPMPEERDEFESRALLYHILMDIEDFLYIKKRFVDGLDETQRRLYWK